MAAFEAAPTILTDVMAVHARRHPDRTALVCGEARLTWRELNQCINRVANGLLACGLQKGDKVAMLVGNIVEAVELLLGIVKAGGVVVPLSGMLQAEALLLLLEDSDAKYLFAGASSHTTAEQLIARAANIDGANCFSIGFVADGWNTYSEWIAKSSDSDPRVVLRHEDDFNVVYSSGTTGVPKGIVHNHYVRAVGAMASALEQRMDETSVGLVTTPIYSNGTWVITLFPVLMAGGTVVVMRQFDLNEFIRLTRAERCTHTFMVPTQFVALLTRPEFNHHDLPTLKLMLSSGAPLRTETKRELIARFPGALAEGYGLSEGVGTILNPEDIERKTGSVGVPILGNDIRIVDEAGAELLCGGIGEIVGFSSAMLSGYYKKPELTEAAMWRDERGRAFLRTGDIGRMDEDGYLYLLDRKKDMIISGGANVFAADIEEVFARHPAVSEVAVIGVPDAKWGETPLALVILKGDATAEDLLTWANAQLGKHQRVARVEFCDAFPRNALGKVLKKELRAIYQS